MIETLNFDLKKEVEDKILELLYLIKKNKMTRQDYLQLRQQNNLLVLWLYYIEECKEKGIEQLIGNAQDLLSFLSMWRNINEIYADVIKKLDDKFTITKIYNTEQQLIGIL